MSEHFKPVNPEEKRADAVDRALDASHKPTTRFSGRLSKWFAGLMAGAAVASGEAGEVHADKLADAQARVANASSSREFNFDSKEEQVNEKAKAEALAKYHAELLAINQKPQIDRAAIVGVVTVDRRIAKHGVLTQAVAKDPREKISGRLSTVLGGPVIFTETTATSSLGDDDVDGYVHDVVSIRNYYPASVNMDAKTSALPIAINMGKDDPRLGSGSGDATVLKQLGDKILDEALTRSTDAKTSPPEGKVVALEEKTRGAVLEAEKSKPRHKVIVEAFKTVQPMGFRIEKRGDSFWLVGVRYDGPTTPSVATAMKW